MTTHDASELPAPREPSREDAIRLAADGELTSAHRDLLAARRAEHGAGDDAAIEFERRLRSEVGRVMGSVRAPEALRAQVSAAIRAEPHAPTRSPAWWRSPRWATAAALVLVALLAVAIASRQRVEGPFGASPARLVAFLEGEHMGCADGRRARKLNVQSIEDARIALSEMVGAPAAVLDLEPAGYRFFAMGRCAVPGPGPSVHIMYERVDGAGAVDRMSVFAQRDDGKLAAEPGVCYELAQDALGNGPILAWRSGTLVYYVVNASPSAELAVRRSLGAPELDVSAGAP